MLWFSLSTQVVLGIHDIKLLLCFTPSGLYEEIKNEQQEGLLDEALTTTSAVSTLFFHSINTLCFVSWQLTTT